MKEFAQTISKPTEETSFAGLLLFTLITSIPAQIAGCERLVVCIPPNAEGNVIPEMLYTAKALGITEVYKAGGAQAIFAMSFGTETIKKVNKIFGPGNQYVVAAKYIASLTDDFPYLTMKDILACIAFAADREKIC